MNWKKSYMQIVIILFLQPLFWIPHNSATPKNTRAWIPVSLAAAEDETQTAAIPGVSKVVVSCFTEARAKRLEMEKRTSSILHGLGKNLILESTRGEKEVALYQRAAPGVVLVVTEEGVGSGVIIDRDAHVVTNWHVVKDVPNVVVVFKPKDSSELKKELAFKAMVQKIDQVTDLALLKIDTPPEDFVSLQLGDASSLAVGQDVHAIGHPEGEVWTYSKGVISQIREDYSWITEEGVTHKAKVIQSQTPINPGNSGGPLLDDNGRVIGINSFRKQGEGLNYAVAVDSIQGFMQRKLSRVVHPAEPQQDLRCNEKYDTRKVGWPYIVGCYYAKAAPPPNTWIYFSQPKGPAEYMALDSEDTGHINDVIISEDQQWKSFLHFMDTDCDGTVDIIGHQYAGTETVDSYRIPDKTIRLNTLAKELDTAIKRKIIPYRHLRICQ